MTALALALAGFLVWTIRLGRLARRVDRSEPGPADAVSIVVPARDEAENLPALLGSLAALDPAPGQVIVVDDHSRDGTGELARAAGVDVVVPPPLPDGVVGKPWACQAGSAHARGDLLLFTDADTVHGPGSLARTVGRLRATGADLVSVVPTHVAVRWWEHLQGAFHLLLLVASRPFVIGQYLLFRRSAYRAIGGHGAVLDVVAEDLALARAIERRGGRYELVVEPGLLRVRMYPDGLASFVRGWRRNLRVGIGAVGPLAVVEIVLVIVWLAGLPLALGGALLRGDAAESVILGVAWAATIVEVARRQRLVGDLPWWGAALAPLAIVAFTACTLLATWDQLRGAPVRWRGRAIRAPRWGGAR